MARGRCSRRAPSSARPTSAGREAVTVERRNDPASLVQLETSHESFSGTRRVARNQAPTTRAPCAGASRSRFSGGEVLASGLDGAQRRRPARDDLDGSLRRVVPVGMDENDSHYRPPRLSSSMMRSTPEATNGVLRTSPAAPARAYVVGASKERLSTIRERLRRDGIDVCGHCDAPREFCPPRDCHLVLLITDMGNHGAIRKAREYCRVSGILCIGGLWRTWSTTRQRLSQLGSRGAARGCDTSCPLRTCSRDR
jgi:hypothetical protein